MLPHLYVEKRPVIYDVLDTTGTNPNEILLLCDEQITLDRYSVFDTSTLQNLLLGNTTDPLINLIKTSQHLMLNILI